MAPDVDDEAAAGAAGRAGAAAVAARPMNGICGWVNGAAANSRQSGVAARGAPAAVARAVADAGPLPAAVPIAVAATATAPASSPRLLMLPLLFSMNPIAMNPSRLSSM